ncbi:MAG: sigma-70 family RNA polymerase sigma factor [Bryobacteraceae bacterium]
MDALSEAIVEMEPGDAWRETERIFRAHYAQLARVIAKVIRDPARAEEIAVEVCLKWSAGRKAPGENAERWLYRAAVQVALNELRRQTRPSRYERLVSFVRGSPTPEEVLITRQEQERVRLLLASIERRQAELLVLRSQGFSYEELASILNLNPASVGTLLSRAQQAFRKEYTRRYGTGRLESK